MNLRLCKADMHTCLCKKIVKVLMKRKTSCSDYGFMITNFEHDSKTPFTVFFIFIIIYEILRLL